LQDLQFYAIPASVCGTCALALGLRWQEKQMSDSGLQEVLERHKGLTVGTPAVPQSLGFSIYAVSNLRGGIGKTSIAFNSAFELSKRHSLLVADVCPQCNLTELVFRKGFPKVNISASLLPRIMGPSFGEEKEDISYIISDEIREFKENNRCYFVPGDPELFAFPSMLYQQLNMAFGRGNKPAVSSLLHSLREILKRQALLKKCDKILIDTSPFYAGGTHIAWAAADALIVPIRVDENSIYSFELLLKMLTFPEKDFLQWNSRATEMSVPKIAVVVMTMVGASTSEPGLPDNASRVYIERALKLAEQYPDLFPNKSPASAFVLAEDFRGAGKISGALGIPLSKLEIGEFKTVDRKRIQVNKSATRYQNQIRYIGEML
jgi:chromosome partitioning protein